MNSNQKISIVTHSGIFHCDDVCACTLLKYLLGEDNVNIIRTRDMAVIEKGDYVVDVGLVYDPDNNRFDHHQRGCFECFECVEESSEKEEKVQIPMSSIGMVYKKYGKEFIRKVLENSYWRNIRYDKLDCIYRNFYSKFVREIDAIDNGVKQLEDDSELKYKIHTNISSIVSRYNRSEGENDLYFDIAGSFVLEMMTCIINDLYYKSIQFDRDYESIKHAYENRTNDHLLIFDTYPINLVPALLKFEKDSGCEEIKLVIYPSNGDSQWNCRTISLNFNNRHSLLSKEELLEKDRTLEDTLIFVHNNRFIGATKTRESAIRLALVCLS